MSHIIGGTPFGQGDTLIDPRGAVLLDGVKVVLVGVAGAEGWRWGPGGGGPDVV